ncbi:cytochrome P450 [Brachybacterium sp. FME24]|uniref:cytochrome P450 n=1 Tax=Brachybacterium sp. FME24 TaxID=2742605 RepID=UPI0018661AFE|nr:cytochrome P450 [Brachybacterium sp. FME24]
MSCPFHDPQQLPRDGTPLRPSPTIAHWRDAAPAVPLLYDDDHVGLVVTRYDAARAILSDPRFSQLPHRMPTAVGHQRPPDTAQTAETAESPGPDPLDDQAKASIDAANLLALDGATHQRMRRGITGRFSVKQVRTRQEWVGRRITQQLDELTHGREAAGEADLFASYAQPIAAATHCLAIGVPDDLVPRFRELFTEPASLQAKFDFIRKVVARREGDPGEDVITDLLASDFSRVEAEGLVFQLMSAGHDSVAYLIATASVALLSQPEQAQAIREDPSRLAGAVEEFMRTGAMFLTLFPRTATEDVEIEGVVVERGRTVSVSPVGANRDPQRWERAEEFDIERDAFGHLGFGHGPHGCIGQQLARLEIREAIRQLLERFEDLRLVDAEQTRPLPFANPVATYEAGAVRVRWGDAGSQ